MKVSEWKDTGQYFQFKDFPIFYREGGEGETLLLIHGFPTASWDWHKLWHKLVQEYHLIALDMLGFGFSAKPQKYSYSILEQADIIESLLSSKGISKVHILSHDYGDTVAQELLSRFESKKNKSIEGISIHSICFLNGGLFPETHQPLLIQRLLMSPLGALIASFFTKEKLAQNLQKIFGYNTQPSQADITAFWELITYNAGKKVFHLLIRYMKERIKYRKRWVGALQKTSCPMLLINGSMDPISGVHMAKRYRELIPDPKVVSLATIGHFPLLEAPEEVLKAYQSFRA